MKDKGYLILSAIITFALLAFGFFYFSYTGAAWTFCGFSWLFGFGLIAYIFGKDKEE